MTSPSEDHLPQTAEGDDGVIADPEILVPTPEDKPRRGRPRGSGTLTEEEKVARAIRSPAGKALLKRALATQAGREFLDLGDVVVEHDRPDPLTVAEFNSREATARHERRKYWGIFGFAIGLHVIVAVLVASNLVHYQAVARDPKSDSETRKAAEASADKITTAILAYIFGTVGGFAFRTSNESTVAVAG